MHVIVIPLDDRGPSVGSRSHKKLRLTCIMTERDVVYLVYTAALIAWLVSC